MFNNVTGKATIPANGIYWLQYSFFATTTPNAVCFNVAGTTYAWDVAYLAGAGLLGDVVLTLTAGTVVYVENCAGDALSTTTGTNMTEFYLFTVTQLG
jgi:hypothetical protein